MGKRVRRRVGEAKGGSTIAEQRISYTRDTVESPALLVLSRAAHLAMRGLEAEHMAHGGAENGKLIVTDAQFEEWGVHRDSAIRELVALGFVKVTGGGHAGAGCDGDMVRKAAVDARRIDRGIPQFVASAARAADPTP